MPIRFDVNAEWLEADGLGGFASGTAGGVRTRRYHALLLAAAAPPTGRFVLVNGLEAWVDTPQGSFALSTHAYAPGVTHPDGLRRLAAFEPEPWPRWTFALEDGAEIVQEILVPKGSPAVVVAWRLTGRRKGVILSVRPLMSGRDYHGLHHANPAFRFEAEARDGRLLWRPYPGVPAVAALANCEYLHQPDWFRNFLYAEEAARGLDAVEDLASPGVFKFDLTRREAVLVLAAETPGSEGVLAAGVEAGAFARKARDAEKRRRARFPSRLHRAADAYLVRRDAGATLVAGYPWFADWGRDTFIALRGLCLAAGNLDAAREILLQWAGAVSEGMLPNRFPDQGDVPEYNSVDAALWYVVAVHDYLEAAAAAGRRPSAAEEARLAGAVESILDGYARGTRYGIRMDADGLLAAGRPGVQLTWMDAKVGDWVVTPRIGKPVEVEALWLNALRAGAGRSPRWKGILARGTASFQERFWNAAAGCLHDVVDVNGVAGAADAALRPNQIFAVGGLPFPVLEGERARAVVDAVESRLLTPMGLRSLAPGEPGYTGRYEGGVRERDGAYHQGTVWPWLLGPFVEAWVRARGGAAPVRREARERFLEPLLRHLDEAGIGHVSEIADGDPPHTPRGCPFQAWSVGEALRLDRIVLAEEAARPKPRPAARASTAGRPPRARAGA
jgi:predicted glycogen debranching enzyme